METPEKPFLLKFFATLNLQDIRYAVMRNSETLPDSLGGSDLDLLVEDRKTAQAVVRVAKAAAETNGGTITVLYQSGAVVCCLAGMGTLGWWGCHVDIFVGLNYYGIPYVYAGKLLARRVFETNEFYRLDDAADVVSFVKEMLYTGKTRKDYYPKARRFHAAAPAVVSELFAGCYGENGWKILDRLLNEEMDSDGISCASRKMARCLFAASLRRSIFGTLKAKTGNLAERCVRVVKRPGFCVTFLGTDGSGKSTLIESVKEPIERMLHSKVHYEHLRPNMLPSLARLAGKPQKDGPTTDPHGGKVAGRISSLVRFAYYYVDYVVGYWLKIFPILVKRPSMVFFDRYYYEYMIDPRRCAVRLPRGWARFWSWFIPKPDLILCLGGNPEKIYARKPETSLEEVRRQVAELKNFCERNKRAVWIDTTTNIESSRDAAIMAITEKMAARYK